MPEKARLGDVLVSKGFITKEQLQEALEEQKKKGGFLGQVLIDKGLVSSIDITKAMGEVSVKVEEEDELGKALIADKLITEDQLKKAQEKQKTTHEHLTKILSDLKFMAPEQIAEAIGKIWNIPYISLADHEPRPDMMQLIPEDLLKRHQIVPIKLEGKKLVIAMTDPLNILAIDEVRLVSDYQIEIMVATERDISLVLDKYFSIQRVAKEALLGIKMDEVGLPQKEKTETDTVTYKLEEGPVIKLVDTIIDGGINAKASDIHMEPQEEEMRVRYRIDGILHDILNVPKGIEATLVSRIKVLANMDIAEKRKPQDGHIGIKKEGKQYDLRVSSFATVGGEKIVLRILDKSGMLLGLSDLGLSKDEQKIFQTLVSRPYGIILVTGPTGSGKSTTLYAVLSQLNSLTKNIITVEDPVEYKLEGINQSQVNTQAGITFARGLRAILRQDPDVIMVGEIRDAETAEIAIHAALTGHLVFSTLHTNDAPGSVARLVDMGIEPFLISSSLIGVLAQRLIRTICQDCKETYTPDPAVLKSLGLEKDKKTTYTFARGKGCRYCLGRGYRGRSGVFEFMEISDNIRMLITKRVPSSAIKEAAMKEGMNTLRQSALQKVLEGVTTPEEYRRAIFAGVE